MLGRKHVAATFFGRQGIHQRFREVADGFLPLHFGHVELCGHENGQEFVLGIVVEQGRGQIVDVAAIWALAGVQTPGQKKLLEFGRFADINDAEHWRLVAEAAVGTIEGDF